MGYQRVSNRARGITNSLGLSVETRGHGIGSWPRVQEALARLAANSRDACALVTVYDEYGDQLKASAVRWFGKDLEVRKRAVNSILVAIARQAGNYDPQSMDAAVWIRDRADSEARRLREALDGTLQQSPATRGDV